MYLGTPTAFSLHQAGKLCNKVLAGKLDQSIIGSVAEKHDVALAYVE